MTRDRRRRLLLPVLLGATALACAGEPGTGDEGRRVPEPGDAAPSPVTAARYLTELAFVPFRDGTGPAAYLRLAQDVTSDRLALDYRGWGRGEDGWRRVLADVDTLPVPRAGWRVLPTGSLRVVAGEGGRLRALTVREGPARLRLEPDSTLVAWTGPTGQRERLLLGRRTGPDTAAEGMVVERRRALPREAPGPDRPSGFLLVTTDEGDGLLVLLQATADPEAAAPDSATAAYGRLDGTVGTWDRVRLTATDAGEDDRPRAWRLTVPRVQLQGELEQVGTAPADVPPAGSTARPVLRWVQGTLRLAGRSVAARGVHVETGTP